VSLSVKLSSRLIDAARRYAGIFSRSIPKQIEHWSRIRRIAEENPDLAYSFIKDVLMSLDEAEDGEVSEFRPGQG
jgi:hypothetical protein